jgi:hypothetical protein
MTAMAALARRSHRFLSMRKAPHLGPFRIDKRSNRDYDRAQCV